MAEVLKLGKSAWQITDDEAAWMRQVMQEGGVGLPTGDTAAPKSGPRTVHQRIVQAMRAVSHVAKDGFNTHFKYPFRGIDGVTNALGPALREAGVFPTEEVLEINYRDTQTAQGAPAREATVRIRITFWGEDGDSLVTEGLGESIDQSDKGTAKAVSVARRVAYLGVFLLPTQEPTTDHDGHYHQRGGQPQMSKFERDMGRHLLLVPTAEQQEAAGPEMIAAAFRQALDFRACIEEHAAWEQPSNGEESPTWEELFTVRVAWQIAAVNTPDEGRALYGLLREEKLDMAHNGVKFSQLLKERAQAMLADQEKLANQLTEQILTANDLDAMPAIAGQVTDAANRRLITEEQMSHLRAIFGERAAKLERERNTPAGVDGE